MQRLIAAFQNKELLVRAVDHEAALQAELEAFEFTYSASGVRYEAPPGLHDDGVMALALALHGWDRVQGVPPEGVAPWQPTGDDPNLRQEGENLVAAPATHTAPGDFAAQLPEGW